MSAVPKNRGSGNGISGKTEEMRTILTTATATSARMPIPKNSSFQNRKSFSGKSLEKSTAFCIGALLMSK